MAKVEGEAGRAICSTFSKNRYVLFLLATYLLRDADDRKAAFSGRARRISSPAGCLVSVPALLGLLWYLNNIPFIISLITVSTGNESERMTDTGTFAVSADCLMTGDMIDGTF